MNDVTIKRRIKVFCFMISDGLCIENPRCQFSTVTLKQGKFKLRTGTNASNNLVVSKQINLIKTP